MVDIAERKSWRLDDMADQGAGSDWRGRNERVLAIDTKKVATTFTG